MALRAIMIDLDGTLARTAQANVSAYSQALGEYGLAMTPAELEPLIGGSHWKQFLPAVIERAGLQLDPAPIAARKAAIYAAQLHRIEINAGLVHLLASCRGHLKTALVTSASRTSVCALLAAHHLAGLFELVVTGDDVARHKPDPEAYVTAARHLGVRPEETLIYEDSEIGLASARAFGGHVIQVVF